MSDAYGLSEQVAIPGLLHRGSGVMAKLPRPVCGDGPCSPEGAAQEGEVASGTLW